RVGSVHVSSVAIDAATPSIEVGGTLVPGDLPGLSLPTASIDGLRIAADGSVTIDGAGLTLQDQVALDLYGFQVEVTAVTLGTEERDGVPWNWLGFSGAIRLGDGIPAGASAQGIRVLTERGGPGIAVECDGVGLAFEIPGVLAIDGWVSLAGREFVGDVRFELTSLDLTVDASVVAGQQGPEGATYSYLKVELDAGLPLGVPLGATGLAFYGLTGLFALNMVPDQ